MLPRLGRILGLSVMTILLLAPYGLPGDPPGAYAPNIDYSFDAQVQHSDCHWGYTLPPTSPVFWDDNYDDPSAETNGSAYIDAYTHTIAAGMQVWGYAWARNEGYDGTGAGAVSSAHAGSARVFLSLPGEECGGPRWMRCDWKPRFKARVEVDDAPCWGEAGAQMKGDCVKLDVHVDIKQALIGRTSTEYAQESQSVGAFGATFGQTVPIAYQSGAGSKEIPMLEYQVDVKNITDDTAFYISRVWVNANGRARPFGEAAMAGNRERVEFRP